MQKGKFDTEAETLEDVGRFGTAKCILVYTNFTQISLGCADDKDKNTSRHLDGTWAVPDDPSTCPQEHKHRQEDILINQSNTRTLNPYAPPY